jgi:hypothetical protein
MDDAGKLHWYAPLEELFAYRELLEVGKAIREGDTLAAVVGIDQCWKVLTACQVKPKEIAKCLSIYCVVAICTETRMAKGLIKSCECCARECEDSKARPCKRFVTQLRQPDYEGIVSSIEAMYGLFGITRRHIDAICSVAAKRDETFAKWYRDEYLETEKIQKETCNVV